MNEITDLLILSEEMYDGYGCSNDVGILYFKNFLPSLMNFEFSLLVEHQMMNYPHRYVLDFFLATPFLWKDIHVEIWPKILTRAKARPDTSRIIDQVAQYADIEFLSRYVKVDSLGFVIASDNIDESEKSNVIAYFSKFPYGLVPSELDDDDLDGVYFVEKGELALLTAALCDQFKFKPIGYTEKNIRQGIMHIRGK